MSKKDFTLETSRDGELAYITPETYRAHDWARRQWANPQANPPLTMFGRSYLVFADKVGQIKKALLAAEPGLSWKVV